MHEFSLCQGLVSSLLAQPLEMNGQPLQGIEVTIGPLSGIELQLFEHAYPLVVANTQFKDIELRLVSSDIKTNCHRCEKISVASISDLTCQYCGSTHTVVVQGNECALTHLFYGGK